MGTTDQQIRVSATVKSKLGVAVVSADSDRTHDEIGNVVTTEVY